MGDRVPPLIQQVQCLPPLNITHPSDIHPRPKIGYPEPAKVSANACLVSVATVELAIPDQLLFHRSLKTKWRNDRHQEVGSLRVEVPTEPLKLRGQQQGVCSVELLGSVTPPPCRPAHRGMGGLDLVKFARSDRVPAAVSVRRHTPVPPGYSVPRRACSCSMASNSALKLPLPKLREPRRWMISKNNVGLSSTGLVKIWSM
jgi:hypothetical protein